jgi:ubiquinone/menaquinone biosynthesis C-methylase UbiE
MTSTTLSKPRAVRDTVHKTIAERTKRVYDRLAFVYPLSTFFFHSKAHRVAIARAQIENGTRVLEIACGSGEMFGRIIKANPTGLNLGVDLSPKMAAFTQRRVQRKSPATTALCQASDVRQLPFADASFETVVCCYLFELLGCADIESALMEVRRVLKPGGRAVLVMIGQNAPIFNLVYHVAGSLVPAFWGRQVELQLLPILEGLGFDIESDEHLRQGYYPSRIVTLTQQ